MRLWRACALALLWQIDLKVAGRGQRHSAGIAVVVAGCGDPGWLAGSLASKDGAVGGRCSCQIRCMERSEIPIRLATARPVQCVTSSCGSEQVSASTSATVRVERGGVPGGRVLSRSRPSTPSSAKRCCQRRTAGRLTPARRATSCTFTRSVESRTIRARRMCLKGRDRSPAIAASADWVASSRSTQTV